ncbi:MAG: Gfo/Idh/MocA family oxidoreductase [Solirubrobacterales bacterium]|nr:Gfo/Idh/MocA family oxidoreductase [Solirubrobacterales bacterium]
MKVALCGLGEIGHVHLDAIRDCAAAELVAVSDLDEHLAERAVAEDRAPVYDDIDQMLSEQEIDLLDICLPHNLHLPVALDAIGAGCHVLLEKPMAIDPASCDRITAAARSKGVRVAVSHNQAFFRPHVRLHEMIEAGELGEVHSLYARLWIGGKYRGWREDPDQSGGGLLIDAGVHRIYTMLMLGGPVSTVSAVMDSPRFEDSFVVTLGFASGGTGVIQGAYHGPEGVFDDRIEVFGSKGVGQVTGCEAFFEGDLRDVPQLRYRLDGEWRDDPATDTWDASVARSVDSLITAIAAGDDPPVGPAEGRAAVELIQAAYRSAETGAVVTLTGERS